MNEHSFILTSIGRGNESGKTLVAELSRGNPRDDFI